MIGNKANLWKGTAVAAALGLCTAPALAATSMYTVDVVELNNSGVSGTGLLTHDDVEQTLAVDFTITGLEIGVEHASHLHGTFDGSGDPSDATTPSLTADTDGDGFIELGEGAASYGPVILPFIGQVTANGIVQYQDTFDLTNDALFAASFTAEDLFPLTFREFVIHGLTVDAGIGAGTGGEVDGSGGYLAGLPVGAGEIMAAAPVPIPAPLALLASGLALITARRRAVHSA